MWNQNIFQKGDIMEKIEKKETITDKVKELVINSFSDFVVGAAWKIIGALAFMIVWNLSIAAKLGFPKIGYITALFIVLLGWILKGSSR